MQLTIKMVRNSPKVCFGDLNIGDAFQSIPEMGGRDRVWIKTLDPTWADNFGHGVALGAPKQGGQGMFREELPVRRVELTVLAEVQV